MIAYDRARPLVAIHVPKTAGTSVREIFRSWFGTGLLLHYFDEPRGRLPERRDLSALHSLNTPICVYGHFNRHRRFGIQDYYPDANQFVIILRDPFEMTISHYFFLRKIGHDWKDKSGIPAVDLPEYLATASPNMLSHFPRPVTHENYRDMIEEYFVEVGIAERLHPSLARIAAALGFAFDPVALPHANATERDQTLGPALREAFIERHPLEFAVYDYARSRFDT